MKQVVCFGEILMRLNPPGNSRFSQADCFEVYFGGSEFNVALALAQLGIPVKMVTALPNNPIGHKAMDILIKYKINVDHVLWIGNKMGVYYVENGSGIRGGKVIYDRVDSSFSLLKPGMINWVDVFEKSYWFHWSGINPALNENIANVCQEALEYATSHALKISVDLNYRSSLWKQHKLPNTIMPALVKHSYIILGDFKTASMMLNLDLKDLNINSSNDKTLIGYFNILQSSFPNLKVFIMTLREVQNASHYRIGALLMKHNEVYKSKLDEVYPIVDRIGGGDAFMAGIIYGHLNNYKPEKIIEIAKTTCILKHSIKGDYLIIDKEELKQIMTGKTGYIQR